MSLEDIVYELHCEHNELIKYLDELNIQISDKTLPEETLNELKEEQSQILIDIHEINCDINMYNEIINSYYYSEMEPHAENYDSNYEIFSTGNY